MSDETVHLREYLNALRDQSFAYHRQLHVWLGIAAAGGTLAVMTLVAALPSPSTAFSFFQPTLWCFLIGMVTAALSLFLLGARATALADHRAHAENRNQLNREILETPEAISSPPSIAERMNSGRNKLIKESERHHASAERAWTEFRVFDAAWKVSLTASSFSTTAAFAIPLIQVSIFGHSLPDSPVSL